MKIILSIKPEFVEKIFNGTKKFEFRRQLFKNNNVTSVIIYASAPTSKVVGEFEIEEIIFKDIDSLWEFTSEYSGISEAFFSAYFNGKSMGYAIRVKNPQLYESELCIKSVYGVNPPQSFAYVK